MFLNLSHKRLKIQEWGLHAGPTCGKASNTSSDTTDVERSHSRLILKYS